MARGTPKDGKGAVEAAGDAGDACAMCEKAYGEAPEKDELWIACDECNRWYHGNCAGATQVHLQRCDN